MMPPNNSLDPGQGRAHAHARPSLDDQSHGTNDATGVASGLRPDGYPTRNHSQGVVASHFLAHGGEEETWLQFLRHGSPPRADRRQSSSPSNYTHTSRPSRPFSRTESSSSTSADRKRRLTTADSPMRRPSSIRMHSDNAGDTRTDPIVLESSPLPERPLPPPPPGEVARAETGSLSRRQSDIVLPPWQPDSEVAQCPVCGRHFTFLYRKHHCRKCGRVVCSSCSPHRITIPRQFIVHPPYDTLSNFVDLTGDDDNNMSSFGPFRNPALGGGEEVRVCNPCVPDPNYNPPPQYTTALPSRRSSRPALPPYVPAAPPPRHRSTSSIHNAPQTIGHGQTMRARDPFSTSHNNDTRRMSYHGGSSTAAERWLPPLPGAASQQYVTHHDSRPIPGAAHHSSSSGAVYSRSFLQTYMPPALHPSQPQTPRPARRQVAEEDECPICGNELPPKGPDNDESARDQHVEECIALHSAASVAPASLTQLTSASLPNQRTRGMSSAGDAVGEGGPSSNANRMSHAARGMFSYIATEKDCVDDDGGEAECIICLEDFEAGEKMARLVCWCKFHEKCIKEWWDKKGRGACPTHQLQE